VKELEPVSEQHAIQQAAYACRTLASLALKIRGIERRGVRGGTVMLGVFGESMKQADERLCQQPAELRGYPHGQLGFAGLPELPQFDSLIERHAQHGIAGFEFVDVLVVNLGFFFGKPCSPVCLDGITTEGEGASVVVHGILRRTGVEV
jgi:hypothetical protein